MEWLNYIRGIVFNTDEKLDILATIVNILNPRIYEKTCVEFFGNTNANQLKKWIRYGNMMREQE